MNSFLTWQTGIASVLVVVGIAGSVRSRQRAAWLWAFLLPIDFVTGIPVEFFDVLRYGGAAVLILWVPPDLEPGVRRTVRHLATVMVALAAVRGAAALLHHDANGLRFAVVLLAATVTCYLLALRTLIHRAIVGGYIGGLALSASVGLMQALHWTTLRPGNIEGSRYPGLSTYTMLITWQLVFGLIVATYLVVTRHRRRDLLYWAALALLPVFALASITNGAQGGLVGIAAAILALILSQRGKLAGSSARRIVLAFATVAAVVAGVIYLSNIEIPTVSGVRDGNFRNERARLQVLEDGFHVFRNHPLTGISRTEFIDRYVIAPHFLPIDSAAVSGIVGFAVASYLLGFLVWLVIKGPADRRAATVTGYVAIAAMTTNTLTDSYGPFVGIARALPLFLAVVAAGGQWRTDDNDIDPAISIDDPDHAPSSPT